MNKFTAAAICLTLACALAIPAHATTIVVTNTNDNGPGSLRQALVNANDGDTIDATGISGVITLTSGVKLDAKSGDVVELSCEFPGQKTKLKSNTVVLRRK